MTSPALKMLFIFVLMQVAAFIVKSVGINLDVVVTTRLILFSTLCVGLGAVLYQFRYQLASCNHPIEKQSVRLKVIALRVCLTALLLFPSLLSHLFEGYNANTFVFEYLLVLPVLLLFTPYYVRWAESRNPAPHDPYEVFGRALVRLDAWSWVIHAPFFRVWMVKIFFIPLMYSWSLDSVEMLLRFDWQLNPTIIVAGLFLVGVCLDLTIATGGYIFASRLIGTDIKSTDSTWQGWFVCIICYPPFLEIFRYVREQTDDVIWSAWLLPNEPLYWLWAFLISAAWVVYWMATLNMGLKFSNLSWRGLVEHGVYRYVKHPAYLSKNIYWWLHTVPFIGVVSGLDLLRNLLGLTFVSLVYYLRAKTEERHLMKFPEYAAYSAHIEQNGLFARLVKICRFQTA